MNDDDAMVHLELREANARLRVRAAALDLKDALVTAAGCAAHDHPWSLPAVGFCAGFLSTLLVPARHPFSEDDGHDCRR